VLDEVLTHDERYLLDLAADHFGAFTLLAWLGTRDHQPERAAAIVEQLLTRGLVEVTERSDAPDDRGRILAPPEALHAVRDSSKWRDPQIDHSCARSPTTRSASHLWELPS